MLWKIIISVMFLSVLVACVAALPAAIVSGAGFATGYALGGGAILSLYTTVNVWVVKA